MKALSNASPIVQRAAEFIWRNARMVERAQFAHAFAGGAGDAVKTALAAYQNADGGFGNALEADLRAPDSTPVACEMAMVALWESEIRDGEFAARVCRYLSAIAEAGGRVPIISRAALDYPRAAHWTESSLGGDSPNPTAGLVGMLMYQGVEHLWLERATRWCWERIERPLADAHELVGVLRFLQHAPERELATDAALRLAKQADRLGWYVGDPRSTAYGITPLHLCPRPESIARPAFGDDLIAAHLGALAARQQEDGGWPIAWNAPSPAADMEWRGRVTWEALVRLRAYARI
jgi:hypothetical protein